jgi:hypothetical protein
VPVFERQRQACEAATLPYAFPNPVIEALCEPGFRCGCGADGHGIPSLERAA